MNKKLFLIMMVFLMTPNCVDAQGFLNKIGKALDKVGEVIDKLPSESSSSSSKSSSTSSRTFTTKQGGMTISAIHRNLKIEIKRCEAAGNTVVIDLLFENTGNDDVDFRIWGGEDNRSVAYDDESNMFNNFRVKIGNSDLSTWYVRQTLPAGIPLKGRIQIEGVPESANKFNRIDLMMSSDTWDSDQKITKITNIPITREGDE